jgi:uncharacterized protein YcfL
MKRLAIFLIAMTALLSSCSSDEKKDEVNQQVSQEPVATSKEIQKKQSRDFIVNSKNLTEQQKKDLLALYDKTTNEQKITNDKILQTKTVMIKSLMAPKQDSKKISILRTDLKNLEKKRTDMTIRAFDQAQIILTPIKDAETRQKLYEDFMIREGHYY